MSIRIENLTKEINQDVKSVMPVASIEGINLEIPDGKILGLIGPSFSGKTSLLYLISGLSVPTDGNIYFNDVDVTKFPPEKRNVGFVFKDYMLYPHLTVLENIMFPLIALKEKKKVAKEKAMELAEFMGLTDILSLRPSALTSQNKILVAIARAYVKNPNVVLLDEPLAQLDTRYRNQTKDLIKKVQRKTGITTVFVSHNQEDTISISDIIALMKSGSLKAVGKPEELYANPENQFVAELLCDPAINVLKCIYNDDEDGIKEAEELYESGKISRPVIDEADLENMPEIPKGILKFGDQVFLDDKIPAFGERMILTKDTRVLIRPEWFDINENGKYIMHVLSVDFNGREKIVKFNLPGIDREYNCLVPHETKIEVDTDVNFNLKKYFIFDTIGRRIK